MSVLITSASRKVSLVEAFRSALQGSGEVIAADITLWAAAMHRADRSVLIPPSEAPEFIDVLLELCEQHEVELLVPTRDDELSILSASAGSFAAIGTRVHVSPPQAIEPCLDKRLFHEFCVDNGFPVPDLIVDPNLSDLPLFVRPRRGKGSVGIGRVDREDQLQTLEANLDMVILNRIVEAPEYTIDVFISEGGALVSAVPRERVTVVAGESYVARTTRDSELAQSAADLCLAMGLIGHNTVQAFRLEDHVSFIEVNPRFGGGAALGFAAGAPTPEWLLTEVRGGSVEALGDGYDPNLVMLRYTNDVFIDQARLQK